jgi:uncharacterized RDD family membrane protein YckC
MTQPGQPGAPQPGGYPPGPPPQGPPPPQPPTWQTTPQSPQPPQPGGYPPQQPGYPPQQPGYPPQQPGYPPQPGYPSQQPGYPPAGGPATGTPQFQMPSWTANLTSTVPVAGPAGYYYADVPNRAIAYIIDAVIIGIVGFIIGAILYGILGPATTVTLGNGFNISQGVNLGPLLIVTLVGLAINAGYFIYTWVYMRGTIGMRALSMQVGNETDGATLTMNQAVYRWILLGAPFTLAQLLNPWPGLGLLISLLGFIWFIALLVTTAQSPTKQGLHDRYAHTMVVKAARAVA